MFRKVLLKWKINTKIIRRRLGFDGVRQKNYTQIQILVVPGRY